MAAQPELILHDAQPSNPTYLAYSPDGSVLSVAGDSDFNNHFIAGFEEGDVSRYSIEDKSLDRLIVRCSLPVRDLAVSPDNNWCAVASDECSFKIASIHENKTPSIVTLPKPAKHVAWDPKGRYIAVSCTNGIIYVHSMTSEGPRLVREIDGIVTPSENESLVSTKAVWHPDGRTFAAPTATRDIQLVSPEDGEKQRRFTGGHSAPISALAWSPNGALLVSASLEDDALVIWETKTQRVLRKFRYEKVMQISWHPTENILSWTNALGQASITPDFLDAELEEILKGPKQASPLHHDPLKEISGNARRPVPITDRTKAAGATRREGFVALDDEIDMGLEDDSWIEDDDGGGYTNGINGNGKRTGDDLVNGHSKRMRDAVWRSEPHQSFQPGETGWRGGKRYLCMNLIGNVWTVNQDPHHTITVEFYDQQAHRRFYFTDTYLYDKASLNDKGTLFSCPATAERPSMIFYRPHETWTTKRADWHLSLPDGEEATAISLSDSKVIVCTSAGYVRIYTHFGTPVRIHRLKNSPIVTCASHGDMVLTVSNGALGNDGNTQLNYTLDNTRTNEIYQNEDLVAIPPGASLKNVFFSDQGDPYIYDSTGTLLTLLHWRDANRARWTPLLDTRLLPRQQSGRKDETYWALGVLENKFRCMIVKGQQEFPTLDNQNMSTEFEFWTPVGPQPLPPAPLSEDDLAKKKGEQPQDTNEMKRLRLEEGFVRAGVGIALLADAIEASASRSEDPEELQKLKQEQWEADKKVLHLLQDACLEGEEQGMKAVELVKLLRNPFRNSLKGAMQVVQRYAQDDLLQEKVAEVVEELGEEGEF
ncbi:MAG: hypothetical protein Q9227_005757 [Pyrenula ochraceoflavens]